MPMQPGSFAAQMPHGEDVLIRRIQEIERTMREFLPSVALSIKPAMDDIRAQQATLTDQVADIAALVGAQVSPVGFATEGTGWSNGASGGGTVHASVTLTAPTGFTQGLVTANMYVQAVHTGGADYLRVYPEIAGAQGRPGGTYVNAGAGDQTDISYTRLVVATSIMVEARVWSTWAVPADAANIANITGSVLWLR